MFIKNYVKKINFQKYLLQTKIKRQIKLTKEDRYHSVSNSPLIFNKIQAKKRQLELKGVNFSSSKNLKTKKRNENGKGRNVK